MDTITKRSLLSSIGLLGISQLIGCVTSSPDNFEDEASPIIDYSEVSHERGINYEYDDFGLDTQKLIGNAGVYAVDYTRNGWTDLLLLGGETPRLYKNERGKFTESEALPSLDIEPRVALFFDHNLSGYDDLLLLPTHDRAVFLENVDGNFTERECGLGVDLQVPIAAAAGDTTGDGYPDIFVVQNGDWSKEAPEGLYTYPVDPNDDNGGINRLFQWDGTEYKEETAAAGIRGKHWSLATSVVDFTGNGVSDIHVANDFQQDALYRNLGDGTFEKTWLGEQTDRNGMSSALADITGNGELDIFVTNIWFPSWVRNLQATTTDVRARGNNLLVNDGTGQFEDRAEEFGVHRGGWGWAAVIEDITNSGQFDIIHATQTQSFRFPDGRISAEEREELHGQYKFFQYPAIFEGSEDGFDQRSANNRGLEKIDSRGIATLDFDRDGRIDIAIAGVDGQYRLYRNTTEGGSAIQVDVRGTEQIPALGTEIELITDNRSQYRVLTSRSDFLSQSSRILHFGVRNVDTVSLRLTWPDGVEQAIHDLDVDRRFIISPEGIRDRIELD